MPVNPDAVGYAEGPTEVSWTSKECLLYALGVGAGALDPTGAELPFTTENSAGVPQQALPTLPVVLAGPGSWRQAIGDYDPAMLVHGEQSVELHAPLPVEGTASVTTRITGVYDKGSGAVVETETVGVASGRPMYTLRSAVFIRGAGGWGGDRGPSRRPARPDGPADATVTYPTRLDQALLYRLSGDRNPLHSDPAFAARAGFERPILHGLCTFGFTGRALLHARCGSDPQRFVAMGGRFSRPVLPGEPLTVEIWDLADGEAAFRTSTPAGVVLDGGTLRYLPSG
ncbi:MAG TPA: MaoC/PaaZ C-terminal domain-containing protein [Acidimicrobiales bacterium]|nr:MaoC/PaaZ C-terminal domain-containing protein [Acidimicrobiales bacterium]